MKLALLGPPASGKGTQAEKLSKYLDIPHISTGDIFRENISLDTELGKAVKPYLEKGILVPDDIVVGVILAKLEKERYPHGFILDGFPRTIVQAKLFRKSYQLDRVIYLEVDDETVIKRISGRRICSNCGAIYNIYFNPPKYKDRCDVCGAPLIRRKDDTVEVAEARLKEYKEKTSPLIEFYESQGLLSRVNGAQASEAVFKDILSIINNL